VIEAAQRWEEPIRIVHAESGKSVFVRFNDRAIFLDLLHDTAAILIDKKDLPLPAEPLMLAPAQKFYRVGNDLGWLGFPAVSAATLCFFGGRVSAWLREEEAYLVDGVAINGVSGGPAFHPPGIIMGVVSAYIPNRATGEVLPGLSVIRSVTQFHKLAPMFKSLEEAKAKETPPVLPPGESKPEAQPAQPQQPADIIIESPGEKAADEASTRRGGGRGAIVEEYPGDRTAERASTRRGRRRRA